MPARRFTLAEIRHLLDREQGDPWRAFNGIGVPDGQAPPEIAADMAQANELIRHLNEVFGRIGDACGYDFEEEN
jgi:hypothetical protein